MHEPDEIRDQDEAVGLLTQSFWLQRVVAPQTAEEMLPGLELAAELASAGEPVPPLGLLMDVSNAVAGLRPKRPEAVTWFPPELVRAYDDYVVGRMYSDSLFDRACAAIGRMNRRDQVKGVAYLANQLRVRTGMRSMLLNPAVIRTAAKQPKKVLAALTAEAVGSNGMTPRLLQHYEQIVSAARLAPDLVGAEDVFELERGTALAEFGRRMAVRQVLEAATYLYQRLDKPRKRRTRYTDTATQIVDEDLYPIGGYVSISNRGSVESMLHFQLAYMERDTRPDLFDAMFMNDELFYYSRDENQFHRRRRTYVITIYPNLDETRVKDAGVRQQRIVRALGLIKACIDKTIDWMSTDALTFDLLFVDGGASLAPERDILTTLFSEEIASGAVKVGDISADKIAEYCKEKSLRSKCVLLAVGVSPPELQPDRTATATLGVNGRNMSLKLELDDPFVTDSSTPDDVWRDTAAALMQLLIS